MGGKKRNIEWIEAARSFLMVMILLTETTNNYFFVSEKLPGAFFVAFRCLLYIGVPGFLIISGYLTGIGLDKEINRKNYIIKKAKMLMLPFFYLEHYLYFIFQIYLW